MVWRADRRAATSAAIAGLSALAWSGASFAQTWGFVPGSDSKEIVRLNKAHTAGLVLACRPGPTIWVKIELGKTSGWTANLPLRVRIGAQTFEPYLAGYGGGVALFEPGIDRPMGDPLRSAMRHAETLVLEGPAVQKMPPDNRVFDLVGLPDFLTRLERACGLPLTR